MPRAKIMRVHPIVTMTLYDANAAQFGVASCLVPELDGLD